MRCPIRSATKGNTITTDDLVTKLVADRIGDDPVCLYGYDLDALAAHVHRIVTTLPEPFRMFYAMKANSARPILETLAPTVSGFEVASGGEVAKARAVSSDVPVIFGGPAKTHRELADALDQGAARFHVESPLELHRISSVAAGRTVEVLLRVNLRGRIPSGAVSMAGKATQFGIDEACLPDVVGLAKRLPGIRLVGFHLHSVSNLLDAGTHLDMLALYRDRVLAWEAAFGVRCTSLNFGGGIGVNYADLDAQFDWTRFTHGLTDLARTFPQHWTRVDFECGRYLVAACGRYATEVLDLKRNHGVTYAVVRGGTHHFRLPASWQHSHPFTVLPVDRWRLDAPRPEARDEPVTVVGELCTPKDVLARDTWLPKIRAGDVLVFSHTGAYGWDISHHDFLSHPHPERVFTTEADHSRNR